MAEEQKIVNAYNRNRLTSANQRVREQLAGGMPPSVIADRMSPTDRDSGLQMMASMSLAETHDMPLGQSLAITPSIMEQAFGKSFSLESAVSQMYKDSAPFSIPFKPISDEDINIQIATEEEGISRFKAQKEDLVGSRMPVRVAGAFNQAFMSTRGILEKQREFDWFGQDPQKGEFYLGMIDAETEDQRISLRRDRFTELFGREQNRIEKLKNWEDAMQHAKYEAPGVWESKVNAWRQGSGRVAQASLDLAGDLTALSGKVVKSQSAVEMGNGMSDWARAYHGATQLPELSFKSVNAFDKHTNNFLANAPYTGVMVTAAMVSPDKVTPFVMFAGGFSMASSSIKQTSMDNGIPVQSANTRGWIGGSISGMLEGGSGGAAKFAPAGLTVGKRISSFAGKLTKNALKEILLEELPQEAVEAMFASDVPKNADGSINWDQVTDRVIDTAIGAAYMSTAFTTSSSVVGEALAWDAQKGVNKDSAQAMQDAMDVMTSEQVTQETTAPALPQLTPEEQVSADADAQEASADKKATNVAQELANQTNKTIYVKDGKVLTSKPDGDSTEINPAQAEQGAASDQAVTNLGEVGQLKENIISLDTEFDVAYNESKKGKDNADKQVGIGTIRAVGDGKVSQELEVKTTSLAEPDTSTAEVAFAQHGTENSIYRGTEGVDELASSLESGEIKSTGQTARSTGKLHHLGKTFLSPNPNIATSYTKKNGILYELKSDSIESQQDEGAGEISIEGSIPVSSIKRVFRIWRRGNQAFSADITDQVLSQPTSQAEQEATIKEVSTPKEQDAIEHETEVVATPVKEQVKDTVQYGATLQPDGKFTVTDWETQQEVKTGLSKEQAVREATALNAGEAEVKAVRPRDILPTSQDIETLTHTQLLRNTFKSVERHTREAVKSVIGTHKDLAAYAKSALASLDVSESQRNALINKVTTATNEADKESVITVIEGVREVSRKRKAISKFKKIRALVNKKGKLKIRDGGIHFSTYDVLSNMLSNYTTLKGKTLNAVKRAKTHLDNIRQGVEGDFNAAFAEAVMPKGLTQKFSEIMATPIEKLTANELDDLNNTLERYLRQSQLWNKLLVSRQARELKNFLNNATADIKLKPNLKALKGEKIKRGVLKSALDVFGGIKNDDMHTLAVKIWGRYNPLNRLLYQSRRKQLALAMKYRGYLQKVAADNNITPAQFKEWSDLTHDTGFTETKERLGQAATKYTFKIDGEIRDFTMSEMMAVAMHTRNKYNMGQIAKNGLSTRRQRIGKVSPEEMSQILDTVYGNPQAKAFVDAMTLFYMNQAADINKVSRELDGINIATEEDYFHIEYEAEGGVVGTEYVRDSIVDEEGRLKTRTSSSRPVAIRDMFQVIAEDINVVSGFAGTTEATRKMRSLVNYGPFREKMRGTGSEFVLKELDSRVAAYQRTRARPSEAIERAVEKLTRGASLATLINPKIWALQPTSAALYSTESSPKYMKAILAKASNELRQDLDKHWILYSARKQGIGASKSVATKSEIKRIFTGTGNLADKSLTLMHKADIVGVTQAAKIVMAEMEDVGLTGVSLDWWQHYGINPNALKYGTAEYWQAFNDRADHLVTLTQPMFFPESRSAFTGSENPYTRALFRFRGFIDQIGRIVRRNIDMARYGEVSRSEMSYNMGVALTTVSVFATIFSYGWAKLMGKDPKADDLLRDMLTAPLSTIPLIGYPLKQIANTLIGGEGKVTPSFSAMPLMMINRILKHSWDTARGISYVFDDEIIQSGPNKGKKKSETFMKRGIVGATSDALMLQGVPVRLIENIEWFKE